MREITPQQETYCPKCGNKVPTHETCWLHDGRFYCTEACVREAVANR